MHQFNLGLKVHNSIVFTEKPILAVINNTQYVRITDNNDHISVFLKINVTFDKNTCIKIKVQPAVKVKMELDDQLAMLEIYNHNFCIQ